MTVVDRIKAAYALLPSRDSSERAFHILQFVYLGFLLGIFIVMGAGITIELFFPLLVVGFAMRSRKRFVRDFSPFVVLLLSYEAMRGLADDLNSNVYIDYPIRIDELLFGEVPSVTLQRWFFTGQATALNYISALLHIVHFIVPPLLGAIIWQHRHDQYWRFVVSLIFLSYAGFVTFMLVPTAPPWYATGAGHLEGVQLVHTTLPAMTGAYRLLSPNDVAAMPSLHAAYPMLFFLFVVRLWGWKASPFGLYTLGVWFSIMYLGHHYFIDVVAGAFYACVAYVVCATSVLSSRVRMLTERVKSARGVELPASLPEAEQRQAA
jgi:membrane-associated phospholipid phosphatase